jgi:hypothetical protein
MASIFLIEVLASYFLSLDVLSASVHAARALSLDGTLICLSVDGGLVSGGLCPRRRMGLKPERAGGREGIYCCVAPPQRFIARAVDLTVVCAAKRDCKFITNLASEGTTLREPQMVRIRWSPTANQAGLFDDVSHVVAITNATRFRERQHGLVDL